MKEKKIGVRYEKSSKKSKKEYYAVSPFLKKNLLIWQSTFDTSAESPHMYTEKLKGVCYYVENPERLP